ncbi:hypothetical protein BH11PSE2_BH11PSE2_18000 [soil metagenome]
MGGAMVRWLVLAGFCLLWGCTVGPRACDLRGNDGTIHFNRPDRYCPLAQGDQRLEPWFKQAKVPELNNRTTRQAFAPCKPAAGSAGPAADAVVLSTYGPSNMGAAPLRDERRAELLRAISKVLQGQAMPGSGQERISPGVLYWWTFGQSAAGTWVELDAWTVTRATPVRISAVKLVGAEDVAGLGGAITRLHGALDPIVEDFAQANDYSAVHAPDTAEADAAQTLALCSGVGVLGVIFMMTLLRVHALVQALISMSLMAVAVILTQAAPGVAHNGPVAFEVGAGMMLGLLGMVFVWWLTGLLGLISISRVKFTELLRQALSLQLWNEGLFQAPGGASFTKRWFVAVAAATGAVVAALAPQPGVWEEFLHAFSFERIVFTLIIMLVSFTLVGPLEEYVFDSRLGGKAHHKGEQRDAPKANHFEHLMELATPGAIWRLLAVLILTLVLTVAHGTVEARLTEGDATSSVIVVIAGFGPGLITFYWCLALQKQVFSVAQRAGTTCAEAGVKLVGLPIVCVMLAYLATSQGGKGLAYIAGSITGGLIVIAIIVALSAAAFGALGYAGGLLIDIARRRSLPPLLSVAAIGLTLCVLIASYLAVWTTIRVLGLHDAFTPEDMVNSWSAALAAVGWAVGLLISGFPGVLKSSWER